jgi:hypothetical protein
MSNGRQLHHAAAASLCRITIGLLVQKGLLLLLECCSSCALLCQQQLHLLPQLLAHLLCLLHQQTLLLLLLLAAPHCCSSSMCSRSLCVLGSTCPCCPCLCWAMARRSCCWLCL